MPITFRTTTITPRLAAKFLEANVKNRNKKPKKIDQFARDMAAGHWRQTGEAIKFDDQGNLIDGQNRLYAIIQAQVEIEMLVVRGLEPEAQDVMDSGSPRNTGDMFTLHGYSYGNPLAATANVYASWSGGGFAHAMSRNTYKLSPSEALELVQSHEGLVQATTDAMSYYVNGGLRLPPGALAVSRYATMMVDQDASDDFYRRIVEFHTRGKGDPIATLWAKLNHDRNLGASIRYWPSTVIYMMFTVWNAYRADEQLFSLSPGTEKSGWKSIPEPK